VSHEINPNRFSDSAGVPWEGRELEENRFASDDGSAPKEFLNAIAGFRTGVKSQADVVDAIRSARLLVPLLAKLGESEIGANGLKVDKSAELSIVTVKAPDDQDALVVFSSVTSMQRWNPSARPVPTDAIRVCLAAASQLSTRVVIDPGSETQFVIRRPAIARIAQSLDWQPAELNPIVQKVVAESVASEQAVSEFELRSADPEARLAGAELEVAIRLFLGSSPQEVRELLERVSKRWSESEDFAQAVDSVSIKLLPSSQVR
jgi:hypothetical protein